MAEVERTLRNHQARVLKHRCCEGQTYSLCCNRTPNLKKVREGLFVLMTRVVVGGFIMIS